MPSFDAILFDFDGVLLDTEPVHWACWAQVLAPSGVVLEWEFYRDHCIGIDDREMLRMMASRTVPPPSFETLWAQYPTKKELFRQRMAADPPFEPELRNLLPGLHSTYRMAVVSSSSCEEIEPLLERGGIRPCFGTVVGGNQVTHQKPDPEPYLLAATRLGVHAPVVLEDSAAGQASGRAAGFTVVPIAHPRDVPGYLRTLLPGAHPLL